MQSKDVQWKTILVLEAGEPVVASITSWCTEHAIAGASLQAIGAVRESEIGYYDVQTKEYAFKTIEDDREVVSLIGNVSMKEGEHFVHAHISLGDPNMQIVGGHLKEAIVAMTLEVVVEPYQYALSRVYNEGIGLHLLDL